LAQAGTEELRKFVFGSLRSRLALDMLLLCIRRKARFVSVADFAVSMKVKPAEVARVMIDWARRGLFRPTSSGQYCFSPAPEMMPVLRLLIRAYGQDAGQKGINLWVSMIHKKLAATEEDLPALAILPEPAKPQVPAPPPVSGGAPSRDPATVRPASGVFPAAAAPARAYEPVSADKLDPDTVKTIRRYVSAIPPLPIVAQQLLKEIGNPNSSAKSLASIAIKDPGIVLTLLRMANSAFYAQDEEIVDVQRAIVVIGLNNIRHLLMVSGLQNIFKQPKGARGYSFDALWAHALGTSVAARLLVRKAPVMGEAEAGTIGLLHDIGKFAMAVAHPKLTEQLIDPFQGPEGLTGIAKEVALFGSTHAIYGMMLLESWKLPNEFARIIEYHHHPAFAAKQGLPAEILRGLSLVHIANQLAKLGGLECGDREIEEVPEYCYQVLGLPPGLQNLLDDRMRQTFEQCKFFVSGGAAPAAAKGAPVAGKPAAGPGAAPAAGPASAPKVKPKG